MLIMSKRTTEQILSEAGWEVECESPLEIRTVDGSFATGEAALIVLASLRQEAEDESALELARNSLATICALAQTMKEADTPEAKVWGVVYQTAHATISAVKQ